MQENHPELIRRQVELPPGYDPAIAPWVWALEDTRRRTKQGIADLSQEILDWRPPEGTDTIATILYHLVAIEMSYLYEDILGVGWADELSPLLPYAIRDQEERLVVVRGEALATHVERLDASRALLFQTLGEMAPAEFRRARQAGTYLVSPAWIVHHLMQHEAEHRGQILEIRQRAEQAVDHS